MLRIAFCAGLLLAAVGSSACGRATREATANDDHLGTFDFRVEIDGIDAGEFFAVDGLECETEIIEYQDGDDPLLRKRPGRTKYSNITLKRGYVADDDLWRWRQQIVDGQVLPRNGRIILLDNLGTEVLRYDFFECWPCKWKGFSLDGKGSDVNTEEIELAVERLEPVAGGSASPPGGAGGGGR